MDGVSFKGTTMPLRNANFSNASLHKADFEGVDLSGADFSYADLRGASFKNAILHGTNFGYAKMGLPRSKVVLHVFLTLVLGVLAIGVTVGAGSSVAAITYKYGKLGFFCSLITIAATLTVSVIKGVEDGLKISFLSISLVIPFAFLFALVTPSSMTPRTAVIIISIILATFVTLFVVINTTSSVMIQVLVRTIFGKTGQAVFFIGVASTVLEMFAAVFMISLSGATANVFMPQEAKRYKITEMSLRQLKDVGLPDTVLEKLKRIEGQGYSSEDEFIIVVTREIGEEQVIRYGAPISFYSQDLKYGPHGIGFFPFFCAVAIIIAVITVSAYLTLRVVNKEGRQSLILRVAVGFFSRRGTSFENADLEKARFAGVDFRNTNFSGARNARGCDWWGTREHLFANGLLQLMIDSE